jgi:hypothetical protein
VAEVCGPSLGGLDWKSDTAYMTDGEIRVFNLARGYSSSRYAFVLEKFDRDVNGYRLIFREAFVFDEQFQESAVSNQLHSSIMRNIDEALG